MKSKPTPLTEWQSLFQRAEEDLRRGFYPFVLVTWDGHQTFEVRMTSSWPEEIQDTVPQLIRKAMQQAEITLFGKTEISDKNNH